MNPRNYWKSLSGKEKKAFAKRAGTTPHYLGSQILCPRPVRYGTREFVTRLAEASKGGFSALEMYEWQQIFVEMDRAERARRINGKAA